MSDSLSPPRHSPLGTLGSTVAIPQQVTDPTILDSVAGFINEVVPNTTNGHSDPKFQILWARFEQVDTNAAQPLNEENVKPAPIVLSLGYSTGVQVWAVAANGEGREILAWRHGSVKVLKFLPKPCRIGKKVDSDPYESKRPLIAICDSSSSNPQFSSISISSLRTGEQVKVIKFKNTILDIYANKATVVVTFQEKIAVFDAFTFEDRLTVTTCYLSPGVQQNPVALGSRWLAYADKKLSPTRKSCGGNEGEGVQSYTATVLHAAKSLKKGLRELGESVASSLTGTANFKPGTSPNSPQSGGISDSPQKGIITILDIENPAAASLEKYADADIPDPVVAHFVAHTEAIVYLQFDPSGMLLFTADKRGHDFHIFRINPHAMGSLMASVHHLYVLHRGDTTARVQDMCFSPDSRWAAVSTLRGTTHVFPISPYGGNVGVRTHATPHVVNKMSRFHRSAGLTADGRSNSPVSMFENTTNSHGPFENSWYVTRHPIVINPLAQLRQPVYVQNVGGTPQRQPGGRQRLSSSSEEISLRLVACFSPPRTWRLSTCSMFSRPKPAPVESLYTISSNGILVQYDLDPHQASNVPKEKVCNDTPIELTVNAKAQWMLVRQSNSEDIMPPMTMDNLKCLEAPERKEIKLDDNDDQWLSEVEILTHAGPHRRLWMGPQFTFKTYTTATGSLAEAQPLDLSHSKPVNVPISKSNAVLIESGSASSCEQYFLDEYHKNCDEINSGMGELRLKEDLADAMLESPGIRETGGRCVIVQMKPAVAKVVNPLGTVVNVHSDDDNDIEPIEEDVIHENCDEALFRPVVASKTIAYHNKVKRYGDDIITKSLEGTTEVTVKVLKKSFAKDKQPRSRECSPTKLKNPAENEYSSKLPKQSNRSGSNKKTGSINVLKQNDTPLISTKVHTLKGSFIEIDPIDVVDTSFTQNKDIVLDLPQPHDNEDFFSLENITRLDTFEDALECEANSIAVSRKNKQVNSIKERVYDEEDVTEEKIVSKKTRKPKTKLGVKIVNINTENIKTEKSLDDWSAAVTLSTLPKRSWSSIAAAKSNEKSLVDSFEKEKHRDPSPIEFCDDFTVSLQRKTCFTSDLIDINTPQEEKPDKKEVEKDVVDISSESNFLKIDKSSDDEKGDSSSQAEITESDDSGKIPNVSEELTESKIATTTKSSRKKKKRK